MNQNSINAYREVVDPTKMTRKQEVLEALKDLKEATMAQVAEHLGLALHVISGRFLELITDGKIKVDRVTQDKHKNRFGTAYWRKANVYKLV